ncbi:MAG: preprotein translocase subunit SecY [Aggregatilineales bacterium]
MQMLDAARNAFRLPDVRRRLLYTLFILLAYQFATHVTVPGVNRAALNSLLTGSGAGLVSVLNLLSGGAVSRMSVLANGVYPYITAQIILQLLTGVIPRLEAISREPGGQDKLNQYTYYLAIPMGLLQSIGQINILSSYSNTPLITGFGSDPMVTISVLLTMTAGTMFAIWLGELITEQGIGNGLSLIIFAGIVAQVPQRLGLLVSDQYGAFDILAFVALTVVVTIAIVAVQEGMRRIPVEYGRRVRGRKQYGGGKTHIPLRVNAAGMIPLIFAQAILTFPAILGGILFPNTAFGTSLQNTFGTQSGFVYWLFMFLLVVGFTYFYTDVMMQNQHLADNLQKQGGFIPGIRPGKRTQDYLQTVSRRITLVGAVFLGVVAILPGLMVIAVYLITQRTDISYTNNPAYVITGAGLIIVVGVVVDTMRQLEAQLVMRNYEGFMR